MSSALHFPLVTRATLPCPLIFGSKTTGHFLSVLLPSSNISHDVNTFEITVFSLIRLMISKYQTGVLNFTRLDCTDFGVNCLDFKI